MENLNKKIISYILTDNQRLTLYSAYVFYDKNEFKVSDLKNKIHENIFLKKFDNYPSKLRCDNEVSSNTQGKNIKSNNSNKEWFLDVEDENGKSTGYKKLSEIGLSYVKELISNYENKISKKSIDSNPINTQFKIDKLEIKKIVNNIKSGKLAQIPTFQREYVWKHEKVAPLLLSIIKKYPIGTMLFWEKEEKNKKYYIILDGLQRTFSLTLITNHSYAYVNYEIIKYVTENIYKDELEIDEKNFNKMNDVWIKKFLDKDIPDCDKTKEDMFKVFKWNYDVERVVNFIEEKWSKIINEYYVPFIKLNSKYKKEQTTDIFNLINTQGIELSNFEINSSIWSKTPIKLTDRLSENHFIEKWKENKRIEYRNKINIKEDVVENVNENEIEPADFIYSIFDECSIKKYIIRETFFTSDNRLKENALEPIMTIFIKLLDIDYKTKDYKDLLKKIGYSLSCRLNNVKKINEFKRKLDSILKKTEEKLFMFKKIASNSSEKISISIPTSLMSLIINIVVVHYESKDNEDEKIINNLKYIFIREFLKGSYSSGSTFNAWKQLKSGSYKKIDFNVANGVIKDYITENVFDKDKNAKNYNKKLVLILSLFNNKYIDYDNVTPMHVDHLIPKKLFHLEGKNSININSVNTFYNLQLIPKNINIKKSTKIDIEKNEFYSINKFKEKYKLDNIYKNYKKEFDKFLPLIQLRKSEEKNWFYVKRVRKSD